MAAQHLVRQLRTAAPDMQVAGVLQTVEESIEWFRSVESCSPPSDGVQPDVVFMDIHLADGLAFRIFDQVKVPYPIIFTTAYDQYALQAFQVNSIDYLLKPINIDDLPPSFLQGEPPIHSGTRCHQGHISVVAGQIFYPSDGRHSRTYRATQG